MEEQNFSGPGGEGNVPPVAETNYEDRDSYYSENPYKARTQTDEPAEREERDSGSRRDSERDSRDRGRDRDRKHKDRDDKDKSRRKDRSRDRDRDRDRKSRKSRRSRSRSRSREPRRKRQTGFDQGPGMVAGALGAPYVNPAAQLASLASAAGLPMAAIPPQAMTQQATRHARRVYVGGLPPLANEQTVAKFFSQALSAVGGCSSGGDSVVNVYINQEKKFAFVEFRTVEETSNAMALDGITFEGVSVRVRRPNDYNPAMASTLGPPAPNPNLNLAAIGLNMGAMAMSGGILPGMGGPADGPDRIFVGGLPYYLTEDQIRELLGQFGPIKGFDLVKDRETGNSKGYGFVVYENPEVVDIACASLNGLAMGDKTLTVRRATASGMPKPDTDSVIAQAQQHIAMAMQGGGAPTMMGAAPGAPPTRILSLVEVVDEEELKDDTIYEEIKEDMLEECNKYGPVVTLVIPRPQPDGTRVPGVGKVYVEYVSVEGSIKARQALNGRKFGGKAVIATFFDEAQFAVRNLE